MSEKKAIIKDMFQLTFARYCSQGVGFFTSIILRRFLGPFYIGIWSLLKIISEYSIYLSLGVNEGMSYAIPYLVGRNEKKSEEEIKDIAFNFIFFTTLLSSIAVIIATIFLRNKYPVEVVVGLFALSIYMLLDRICSYYMLLLRARKNFSILSKAIIFDAVINICLIVLLVKEFKIYGFYAVVIILAVLNTVFMHLFARYKVNLNFRFTGVVKLIKIGFPITIVGLLQSVLASMDRIMIAKMIGVVFVGYYSVSIMTKNYITQFSNFGTVLYPRILEAFGRNESIEDIKKYAVVPQKVNAYTLPLLLGAIFFIAPVLIKAVLPKFIPGILAIQILLVDMFFRSCHAQPTHFLIVIKKQSKIIFVTTFSIFLTIMLNYVLVKMGYGIYGVAAATSIVSIFIFITLQIYAMRYFAKVKEICLFFIEMVMPFLYTTLLVLLIENFVRFPNMHVNAAVKCFILFIFSIPLLVYINNRTQVIRLIIGMIRDAVLLKRD